MEVLKLSYILFKTFLKFEKMRPASIDTNRDKSSDFQKSRLYVNTTHVLPILRNIFVNNIFLFIPIYEIS